MRLHRLGVVLGAISVWFPAAMAATQPRPNIDVRFGWRTPQDAGLAKGVVDNAAQAGKTSAPVQLAGDVVLLNSYLDNYSKVSWRQAGTDYDFVIVGRFRNKSASVFLSDFVLGDYTITKNTLVRHRFEPAAAVLAPEETVEVYFYIKLKETGPFEFRVDLKGVVTPIRLTIIELTPAPPFILGQDALVTYEISPPRAYLDTVSVSARGYNAKAVFLKEGMRATAGRHTVVWSGIKCTPWYVGAFANPRNSPYTLSVQGYRTNRFSGIQSAMADTRQVEVKLVIEADVSDPRRGVRPAGFPDLLDALKVVVVGGGVEYAFAGAQVLVTPNPSDPDASKHILVDAAALNGLHDGTYSIVLKDLRDGIGNFADADANPANGIQPVAFQVTLQ